MQDLTSIIGTIIISAICGLIFIPALLKFCKKKKLYDVPTGRKVHKTLIPRLGGISFLPSMMISALLVLYILSSNATNGKIQISSWSVGFVMSLIVIYTIGFIDDLIGLDAKLKFVIQIAAASVLPVCGLYINNFYGLFGIEEIPFWMGAPLTVFVFVFIDNAMNLIDGIDGLSASLSIMAFLGFLYCFIPYNLVVYEIVISGFIGVLLTYLFYNIWGNPEKGTKIFMGDAGSLTLGFILAFLFVKALMVNPAVMPMSHRRVVIAYSLLIVPTFDVVRVIIHRLRIGQPIFQPDRSHIHHKLMQVGQSQHKALVTILLLQAAFVIMNTILYEIVCCNMTIVLCIDIVAYTLFHIYLTQKSKRINIVKSK